MTAPESEERWFVLNFIRKSPSASESARGVVARFNAASPRLTLFAPVLVGSRIVRGRAVATETPLTYHYVFVRGALRDVKGLCALDNGFSLLLDRSSGGRYATVTDEAMEAFRIIARACENRLPFYSIADIDLQGGDLVEIADGELAGLRGVFIPRRKSTSGSVVIAATPEFGSVVWDVRASAVRVLEFAPGSGRAYDQADAFVPRLYEAMRRFRTGQRLTARDVTRLTVFCRRMGALSCGAPKLEARVLALLECASALLGNATESRGYTARLERRLPSVTSPWTSALILLLRGVARSNDLLLRQGQTILQDAASSSPRPTAAQRCLIEEYSYHLSPSPERTDPQNS